jgi:hypothetical protein
MPSGMPINSPLLKNYRSGLQPFKIFVDLEPGALPQADIERAFSAYLTGCPQLRPNDKSASTTQRKECCRNSLVVDRWRQPPGLGTYQQVWSRYSGCPIHRIAMGGIFGVLGDFVRWGELFEQSSNEVGEVGFSPPLLAL